MGKEIECASVYSLGSYNMLSALCKRADCVIDGSRSGSRCKSRDAAFKRSDSLLKNILGGIGKSAVNVARVSETETVGGVLAVMEDKRC